MFAWLRKPTTWVTFLLLTIPLLAGCTPDANANIISPALGELETFQKEMGVVEAIPTAAPLTLADFPGDLVSAGLPDEIAVAFANADPDNGRTLHTTQACVGCHVLDPGAEGTGPTWVNLGNNAAERTASTGDASPALYLYNSIAAPGAYIVPSYADGVMPANYEEILSEQDFADLIAFILSQN